MERSTVKLINCSPAHGKVCASAARISTTPGTAEELFFSAADPEKDTKLIRAVLGSGHQSIIEHAVFNLAFTNVSAVVEQFMIEFRLASFTVKSRRYVDFSSMGYYIPPSLTGTWLERYTQCVTEQFRDYTALVEGGAPKEDARFLLPYCFFSNFYCTANARELLHILREIRLGRGRFLPELQDLADQLELQLQETAPYLSRLLPVRDSATPTAPEAPVRPCPPLTAPPSVSVRSHTPDMPGALTAAWQTRHPGRTPADFPALLGEMISGEDGRALETASVTFSVQDLTLSGLTHLVRHRMQSILVPSLAETVCGRYILPATVAAGPLREVYLAAMERATALREEMLRAGRPEQIYLCLSGNTLDALTSMNVRELMVFFRLRCCNRAQWEIRDTANALLDQLRGICPEVFRAFGPSCLLLGRCPEGKLSCGHPPLPR